ncbi:MAG TPA: NAD(P)-dependent oxidoreductase [Streptosporangiaceae bacterium]|jgi:nucleoside-diphosphate-sugar epimerase|nr:NAD(P)-dependent oxidoreductase [Streptosporangiaceae bacterium]
MDHAWLHQLKETARIQVGVTGGAGRLGSWLTRFLVEAGHGVVVLDKRPPHPLPGLLYIHHDLRWRAPVPLGAFDGCDAVVHLAGLHGAHLAAGVDRREFWPVNVRGTQDVLEAAARAGVARFILASSTSVFGSGTPQGEPARVLTEQTKLNPEDVYDLTKVAAERLTEGESALKSTILRFGRFFFPSQSGYHLRKLSTGLDVHDACQAIVYVLLTPQLPKRAYCVASDLPLSREQREMLGLDAIGVLRDALPGFAEAAAARGVQVPSRVSKSVSSDGLKRDTGYSPERTLQWLAQVWAGGKGTAKKRQVAMRRHASRDRAVAARGLGNASC